MVNSATSAGFYERRVLPTLLDKLTINPIYRPELLSQARGRVLEIGFGTGHNAAHYPKAAVERVVALEPNRGVEKLARQRIAAAPVPIELEFGSAESLPFEDRSFDTVVTTCVLCSISDIEVALGEIRRVLAPGGHYLLLEHGLADDPKVQRWQHRLNPLTQVMLGGCSLSQPIADLVTGAGFRFGNIKQFYDPDSPRWGGFLTLASAEP